MTINVPGRFEVGTTVVRRHVWGGKVWSAMPYRVLEDVGDYLTVASWPGLRGLVSTTWIKAFLDDGHGRDQTIQELASGTWRLGWWAWQGTTVRSWYGLDAYFTVRQYFDADRRPLSWYVDFDLPKQRTRMGIDTFDLLLDLVAEPDLSRIQWKDVEEYEHGRRLGLIDDRAHQGVLAAREEVVGLIESRQGPFAHDWSPLPLEGWRTPVLPVDVRSGAVSSGLWIS
ncbi:DUF402 domain-containing protein [Nonomuraea sp. NPDC049400]|uniref:DUF402 domain-containing protein n=1 Tax=Nonomuraea sp. NPDC049400 TaxID=3364352 RepID=UPI0037A96734